MYILSKSDCQDLLLNLMDFINTSIITKQNLSILYCAIDILIIISQDFVFSTNLFKLEILVPQSFSLLVKKLSIGSLISIVMIQILKLNVNEFKDLYLHSGIIAILSNFAYSIVEMEVVFCKKLISTLEFVVKKKSRRNSIISDVETPETLLNTPLASVDVGTSIKDLDSPSDTELLPTEIKTINAVKTDDELMIIVLDDLVAMLLNMISTIIQQNKDNNLNLIYTLLDKQHFLDGLNTDRTFDALTIIDKVVQHIVHDIEKAALQTPRVELIMEIIKRSIKALNIEKQGEQYIFTLDSDPNAHEYFQQILARF